MPEEESTKRFFETNETIKQHLLSVQLSEPLTLEKLLSDVEYTNDGAWNSEKRMKIASQVIQIVYTLDRECVEYQWSDLTNIFVIDGIPKLSFAGLYHSSGGTKECRDKLDVIVLILKRILNIVDENLIVKEQKEIFTRLARFSRVGCTYNLASYVFDHGKMLNFFARMADFIEQELTNHDTHAMFERGMRATTGIVTINWLGKGSVCEILCCELGIDATKYQSNELYSLYIFMRDYQTIWRQADKNKITSFLRNIQEPTEDLHATHFYRCLRDAKQRSNKGTTEYYWLFYEYYSFTRSFFKGRTEIEDLFK
jgi:hypothetical protein